VDPEKIGTAVEAARQDEGASQRVEAAAREALGAMQKLVAEGIASLTRTKILSIKPTDVVILYGHLNQEAWTSIVMSWGQFWKERGVPAPGLWHMPPEMDMKSLDEEQMRALGWIRAPQILKPSDTVKPGG